MYTIYVPGWPSFLSFFFVYVVKSAVGAIIFLLQRTRVRVGHEIIEQSVYYMSRDVYISYGALLHQSQKYEHNKTRLDSALHYFFQNKNVAMINTKYIRRVSKFFATRLFTT